MRFQSIGSGNELRLPFSGAVRAHALFASSCNDHHQTLRKFARRIASVTRRGCGRVVHPQSAFCNGVDRSNYRGPPKRRQTLSGIESTHQRRHRSDSKTSPCNATLGCSEELIPKNSVEVRIFERKQRGNAGKATLSDCSGNGHVTVGLLGSGAR